MTPAERPGIPRALTRARECCNCFGCLEPCSDCIAAAGDPQPHDFDTTPGPVWTCVCGRHYGTYKDGSSVCFVMRAPHHRQVRVCVRCRRDLAALYRLTDDGQQLAFSIHGH